KHHGTKSVNNKTFSNELPRIFDADLVRFDPSHPPVLDKQVVNAKHEHHASAEIGEVFTKASAIKEVIEAEIRDKDIKCIAQRYAYCDKRATPETTLDTRL